MITKKHIGVLSILILTIASLLIILITSPTSAKYGFSLPVSPDEIDSFAIEYTQRKMNVLSEDLQVVHSQSIAGEALAPLGLPEVKSNHSLMLVIVRGDVDISGAWPGANQGDTRYKYLNYVFDLEEGEPIAILAELDDDVLSRVLDPSLRITNIPKPPEPLAEPVSDGAIEPTVKPPNPSD